MAHIVAPPDLSMRKSRHATSGLFIPVVIEYPGLREMAKVPETMNKEESHREFETYPLSENQLAIAHSPQQADISYIPDV